MQLFFENGLRLVAADSLRIDHGVVGPTHATSQRPVNPKRPSPVPSPVGAIVEDKDVEEPVSVKRKRIREFLSSLGISSLLSLRDPDTSCVRATPG